MRIGLKHLPAPTQLAMRGSMLLWLLGYGLVVLVASLLDERTPLLDLLVNGPLWCLAIVQMAGIYVLFRRLESRPPYARWPLLIGACLAAAAVQSFCDLSAYYWLGQTIKPEWAEWATFSSGRVGSVAILYSWTCLLNLSLFWAISLSEHAREQGRRAAEAEAAIERAELTAQRAQLAALRLQLNPHFLFNTLNAISTLVMERDIHRADMMIERLADFLRASLTMDPTAMIPLGEELDTAQAYLDIEAVRFEGRLEVAFHCADGLRMVRVPGFMLQPLVENAVKYAVAPAMRVVKIRVSAEAHDGDLVLRVADDGDPVDPALSLAGNGVGLANTRARLATLYGERGVLRAGRVEGGYLAEVRVPLPGRSGVAMGVAA